MTVSREKERVGRTLIALQAVALACLIMAAVLRLVDYSRTGQGIVVAVLWLALVPIIGGLWRIRPRLVGAGHGVGLTMAAVLMATPVAVFGRLDFTIPVLLLVVAFAVVDVSPRAGVHATIWISGVGFALYLGSGFGTWAATSSAILQGLINVVPVAVLLGFGIALGISLRGFKRRREDDQRIIERLRHASDIEKELLLSDERARSARELHDGMGHRLTVVSMSLELAERMRCTDTEQAWEEIATARETTGEALEEMRTWVRALNPVRDAGARGVAALELIAESFRGTGLAVAVVGDDDSDRELASDDSVALLMYRAVQEGLTNAVRHGRARNVRIWIRVVHQRIELEIANDFGRGSPDDRHGAVPVYGFGLRGVSDRASDRGGFVLARRVGDQFKLKVSVPLVMVQEEKPEVVR